MRKRNEHIDVKCYVERKAFGNGDTVLKYSVSTEMVADTLVNA